jgi:L-fuconolactonase
MRLDAHQHFWKYDAGEYPWILAGSPLQRDWLPDDLAQLQKPLGLGGSIAVQARQTVEESRWLLELADRHPVIRGVVGWVDLRSDRVEEQLAPLARHPKFVGVRHVVQDEPDDNFMLQPAFVRGISQLQAFRLTYDLLVYPKQLRAAIELVAKFPAQPFVLDHIAKPQIKAGVMSPWREEIRELAKAPNVLCKLSGMVTEADWAQWQPADFRPYTDLVCEAFGADRLMSGSDWPVCLLAGSYEAVHGLTQACLDSFNAADREKIMGENARRFYRLK